jgi:hypothetical protein
MVLIRDEIGAVMFGRLGVLNAFSTQDILLSIDLSKHSLIIS